MKRATIIRFCFLLMIIWFNHQLFLRFNVQGETLSTVLFVLFLGGVYFFSLVLSKGTLFIFLGINQLRSMREIDILEDENEEEYDDSIIEENHDDINEYLKDIQFSMAAFFPLLALLVFFGSPYPWPLYWSTALVLALFFFRKMLLLSYFLTALFEAARLEEPGDNGDIIQLY